MIASKISRHGVIVRQEFEVIQPSIRVDLGREVVTQYPMNYKAVHCIDHTGRCMETVFNCNRVVQRNDPENCIGG